MNRDLKRISKSISYLLRHGAPKEKIPYLEDGSILVIDVIKWYNQNSEYKVVYEDICEIVDNDKKGRYNIKNIDGKNYIRCNQGHSFHVVPEMTEITLDNVDKYDIILHGTFKQFENNIRQQGLRVMTRQHIHMISLSTQNPFQMLRPDVELFVVVNVVEALKSGIKFNISTNHVVLSEGNDNHVIPPEYLTFIERVKSPCNGCLVIGYKEATMEPHLAMVQTHNKYWSFPKGKKDKGEFSLQTALRELKEETGIQSKDLVLTELYPFQEYSNKGGLASTYYTVYLKYFINEEPIRPEDTNELLQAVWVPIRTLLSWKDSEKDGYFNERRQDIVKDMNQQLQLIK